MSLILTLVGRKKKSRPLKVITVIAWVFAAALLAPPVGYLAFLRHANSSGRVDTGVIIEMPAGSGGSHLPDEFALDGDLYRPMVDGLPKKTSLYSDSLTPVAKIVSQPGEEARERFNSFMISLLGGTEDLVVYQLDSDCGYRILQVSYQFYCRPGEEELIHAYYENLQDFVYYYVQWSFYDDDTLSGYVPIDFDDAVFAELAADRDNDSTVDLDHVVAKYWVYKASSDGLWADMVSIDFTEDAAYHLTITSNINRRVSARRYDDAITDYLRENLFPDARE